MTSKEVTLPERANADAAARDPPTPPSAAPSAGYANTESSPSKASPTRPTCTPPIFQASSAVSAPTWAKLCALADALGIPISSVAAEAEHDTCPVCGAPSNE